MKWLDRLKKFYDKHWEILTPLSAIATVFLIQIPLMLNPQATFEALNDPNFSASIFYYVIFFIGYTFVLIAVRGGNHGAIQFRNNKEVLFSMMIAFLAMLIIFNLVARGVLP